MESSKTLANGKYSWKIIVIGDYAVGKTSLLHVFTENKFDKSYKPTLGVDLLTHNLTLDDDSVKLIFWDIAGQTLFSHLRANFFKGAAGGMVVFDLNRRESFDNLDLWINEVKSKTSEIQDCILVGNKKDLKRQVSLEEAKSYAEMHKMRYIETSAKTSEKVEEAFHDLIKKLIEIADN